jgi:Putative auto-transporter adhesin, head GIN domain
MRSSLILAFCLLPIFAQAEEQIRPTASYDSIHVKGPADLEIDAGKAHSLTISGNKDYFDRITSEVVDGCLNITIDSENHNIEGKRLPHIRVTLPELRHLDEEGVGETVLTNIDSKRLDIHYVGAGRLAASGKVGELLLKARGVGEVDTQDLIAQDARVEFKGLGSVKIYASRSLDASVNGMGDLIYYGHPHVLKKSVAGFGSFKAGD